MRRRATTTSVTVGFPSGMAGMQRDADSAATCTAWVCLRR